MFKNYIMIALRVLLKDKLTTFIAVLGLTLGLSAFILIYFYADNQLSYDKFLPEGSNVYRVVNKRVNEYKDIEYSGEQSLNLYNANLIKENGTGIKDVATKSGYNYLTLNINNETFNEQVHYVSDNFFKVIPVELLSGNRDTLQSEPNYIILSKVVADKHFPNGDALGKNIRLKGIGERNLKITGIVNVPKTSHLYNTYADPCYVSEKLSAEMLFEEIQEDAYSDSSIYRGAVYLDIENGFTIEDITKNINEVLKEAPKDSRYISEELQLESFEEIYLNSKTRDLRNPKYQLIFIVLLGFIILTVSVLNTISILTASSINRTKEVGVRVVMGSSKMELIVQFLSESIVITVIALILSLVAVELILPSFSSFLLLDFSFVFKPKFLLFIFLLTVLTGVVAGLYPAFYLSSLNAVDSLKGKKLLKLGRSKKIMVIIQFLISSIIVISTVVINREIQSLNNIDPGFNCGKIIYAFPGVSANLGAESNDKLMALNRDLKQLEGVEEITYTTFIPYSDSWVMPYSYTDENDISYLEEYVFVDDNYFNTLEIELKEGSIKKDGIIIMESVLQYRDLKVGDFVNYFGIDYPVVGIVDDYYLRIPIAGDSPKFHIISDSNFYFQIIKYSGIADLKSIEEVWNKYYPDISLDINIHTVELSNTTPVFDTVRSFMNLAMIITFILSFLGLFGLILHRVKLKNKEIGIRKVLGASVFTIIREFILETIRYESVGVLLGIPLGYFVIQKGLVVMGYPFPPKNVLFISVISGICLTTIGCFITLSLFYRSAKANPSKALRYE